MTVESVITSVSDLFPRLFHAAGRHEIFVLVICTSFFFLHLTLVTEVKNRKSKKRRDTFTPSDFIFILLSLQGGIYVFQLIDYYGCTRACQDFMAVCQCVAMAWIFGV